MKKICLLIFSIFIIIAMSSCGNENNKNNYYTVSFDTDGGSWIEDITLEYGEILILPENPTKIILRDRNFFFNTMNEKSLWWKDELEEKLPLYFTQNW